MFLDLSLTTQNKLSFKFGAILCETLMLCVLQGIFICLKLFARKVLTYLPYRYIIISGGENMEKQRPFLFRLTPEADALLEKVYLKLKRKKSKSLIINELIMTLKITKGA